MTHGLHEGLVPTEQRKREFWNMFILDRCVIFGISSRLPGRLTVAPAGLVVSPVDRRV